MTFEFSPENSGLDVKTGAALSESKNPDMWFSDPNGVKCTKSSKDPLDLGVKYSGGGPSMHKICCSSSSKFGWVVQLRGSCAVSLPSSSFAALVEIL